MSTDGNCAIAGRRRTLKDVRDKALLMICEQAPSIDSSKESQSGACEADRRSEPALVDSISSLPI